MADSFVRLLSLGSHMAESIGNSNVHPSGSLELYAPRILAALNDPA